MARILAIDYGTKRVGLAVTDPLQMIATALETVENDKILTYLEEYFEKEAVELLVLGMPKNLDNSDTDATKAVEEFAQKFKEKFPKTSVEFQDERFTSKMALDAMIAGGTKKKYRQNKGNLDKVSAVIILQSYLEKSK